ncbi:GbsR/MarR family transcriptional regulator [Demequina lignilytica]|uniref:Helix-turn-helix domain-containing protein n=1 Tax=Demequina lignilytica TaxID=3051663 RepID=A0AAW7M9R2_9MICO|nr:MULTISPECIES: helix-turn-helix domain-containing protein [unclassified Demequina]MDN4478613.1 helix-turn-helix domain-containing protein [Demequina sp. SYSU T00039-1]MDN4483827.1 helix-turn-helix domain-containing protein [Demequina sp. SYSU T0a273]MDN4488591.1 helix-turn-helix domain-containing protein [Demequina sp. SYSU T00039]
MDDAQHQYVDKVATFFTMFGSTRAWAEILGWLMICEPAERTQAELAEDLGLSAGTVSTQLRTHVQLGMVEQVRVRGERVQRYRLKPGAWREVMTSELGRIQALGDLASAAAPVMPGDRPDRVTELGDLAGFFAREWPPLMARMTAELEKGTP